MALAPFFDKAALAAAAVLHGFEREHFAATLERQRIGLAFDTAAAESFEGRTTLLLWVNLTARLYPKLALLATGTAATIYRDVLESAARDVNPNIEFVGEIATESATTASTAAAMSAAHAAAEVCGIEPMVVVVGDTDATAFGVRSGATVLYVGSDGWEARLSTAHPVGSGATLLPFGAAAAACLGAANVFRHVFRAQLTDAALDDALTFSTLSLMSRVGVDPVRGPKLDAHSGQLPEDLDLGEAVLVGAGAVGQGALWTLARVRRLRGRLHVVDREVVDASNPQRYVLAASADAGTSKVALAHELFGQAASGLRVVSPTERAAIALVPHAMRWGEFLAARPRPWCLPRVLVALDSARDRIAVQAALPRWIANAWTQPGDLGLSRHGAFGVKACLACLYLPLSASAAHEDVLVAEAVGLSTELMLVRHLLATNAPVDDAVLTRMAAGLGVPLEPLLVFRGRPLRAFYSEAVCGGIVLRLQSQTHARQAMELETALADPAAASRPVPSNGQPRDRAAMVPMAFQSVLAGVLLATTAVADAAGLPAPPLGQKAVLNLLRPLTARLLVPLARHGSGKCLCQDADYQAAFDAQWNVERLTMPEQR